MKTIITAIFTLSISIALGQNFTWMRGSTLSGDLGTRGTMGVASSSNDPSGRHGGANWVDNNGNLWSFGGEGYDSNANFGHIGDLWKYNPSTNQWTWVNGQDAVDYNGVYGTLGVPSSSVYPGAREFTCNWVDNSGNFWFFGGYGFDVNSSNAVYLNDIWKYNPTTNQWTWMGGPQTGNNAGTYGTLGVASVTNTPGSRRYGGKWVDNNGNFWLFGGRGYATTTSNVGTLNDMWKYNPTNGQWTWMNGTNQNAQNGVYGTLNVPSSSNIPGTRELIASIKDNNGNFYLFGGLGYPGSGTPGYLNDLWRYNPTTNQWTWLSGSASINIQGVYGSQNIPSASTAPGGRYTPALWVDGNNTLWMFGGRGFGISAQNGLLNDLFSFNFTTLQWTWVKGSQNTFSNGTYGTMGVPAANNIPGAREYPNYWPVQSGVKLWLFAGEGMDGSSTNIDNNNDLWVMNVTCQADSLKGNPMACSGTSVTITAYNSPTLNVNWYSSPTTTSVISTGSVYTQTIAATSTSTTFTVYAQSGTCTLVPRSAFVVTVQPNPTLSITTPSLLCEGINTFTASGASTYSWTGASTNGAITSLSLSAPFSTVTVSGTATTGCIGSKQVTLAVNPNPTLQISSTSPTVCSKGTVTLTVNSNATTYTWSSNSTASQIVLSPTANLTYTVSGNLAGCVNSTTFTQHIKICTDLENEKAIFLKIWPNPSKGYLNIESERAGTIEIFDVTGKCLFTSEFNSGIQTIELNLPAGMYACRLGNSKTLKLIVE